MKKTKLSSPAEKPVDPLSTLFNPKDCEGIKRTILNHLLSFQGRDPERAGKGGYLSGFGLYHA